MSIVWEVIPFWRMSRRGLNPIKLVNDLDQMDGRLTLTASTFNHVGHYTTMSHMLHHLISLVAYCLSL